MNEYDVWPILAEQGIIIEPITTDRSSWQYAFPMLEATWYGPYDTQPDALRAALRHLLLLAQRSFNVISQVPAIQMLAENPSTDQLAAQLKTLKALRGELEMTQAKMGITNNVDLNIRLKHVRKQIAHLEEQLKELDDK